MEISTQSKIWSEILIGSIILLKLFSDSFKFFQSIGNFSEFDNITKALLPDRHDICIPVKVILEDFYQIQRPIRSVKIENGKESITTLKDLIDLIITWFLLYQYKKHFNCYFIILFYF